MEEDTPEWISIGKEVEQICNDKYGHWSTKAIARCDQAELVRIERRGACAVEHGQVTRKRIDSVLSLITDNDYDR